ncbi:hypothetical protein [Haloferax gibbonsii]|uniref:hypothetical protein n=1 Tax=Haloferax gibbonsii TaxID=35746 RepID=UPI001874CBE2|nr:hypothetical protein [Haloferax gibbonsii]
MASFHAGYSLQDVKDAKLATVPRSAFNAPGYARISYAASEERLREAVERLADHDYIYAVFDSIFRGT